MDVWRSSILQNAQLEQARTLDARTLPMGMVRREASAGERAQRWRIQGIERSKKAKAREQAKKRGPRTKEGAKEGGHCALNAVMPIHAVFLPPSRSHARLGVLEARMNAARKLHASFVRCARLRFSLAFFTLHSHAPRRVPTGPSRFVSLHVQAGRLACFTTCSSISLERTCVQMKCLHA